MSRPQEKYAQIPDDLGRSLQAVHALIRRHEGFENDLVALEAQLQVSSGAELEACDEPGCWREVLKHWLGLVLFPNMRIKEKIGQVLLKIEA